MFQKLNSKSSLKNFSTVKLKACLGNYQCHQPAECSSEKSCCCSLFYNYSHPDDLTIRTTDTHGLKPFTIMLCCCYIKLKLKKVNSQQKQTRIVGFGVECQPTHDQQLERVILKLISNSLRYNKTKKIVIVRVFGL